MAVPEAAVNKDHFAATGKYEVEATGQVFAVKTEAGG